MQQARRARGAAENVGRGKDIDRTWQRCGISWIRLLLLGITPYRAQCWCTDWCADISKVVHGLARDFVYFENFEDGT